MCNIWRIFFAQKASQNGVDIIPVDSEHSAIWQSLGFDKMPDWYDQKKRLKDNIWFKSLPSQTAQDILKRVEEGWKSYLKLLKTKGIENPNPPFYKPKGGHYNIKYLNNSFKVLDNTIRLMISKNEKEYLKEKYNIDDKFIYIKLNNFDYIDKYVVKVFLF